MSVIPILFVTFACNFKTLNMEGKDLNRLKIVLVERKELVFGLLNS